MVYVESMVYIFVTVSYVFILSILGLYGVNFLYLSMVALRAYRPPAMDPGITSFPIVTVQLPIFNERYVVERAIASAASLKWPANSLEIQVLDDSTDITSVTAKKTVEKWRAKGINIQYIHRDHRVGYKSGALSNGMINSTGEFIVIFDADFAPTPDFLYRTIGAFTDPRIGFVQTRWTFLNRHSSILTYLQGISIDGHFMIEQLARSRRGYVMNFNGTAGVWRRIAIEDAGGWRLTSITEDLDLSYRAALKGWKSVYLPDVTVPSELVPSMLAFRRQQKRWAQGSADCARRLIPIVLKSRLPTFAKVQALFHLTGYFIQLFMIIAALLYPLIVLASRTMVAGAIFSFLGILLIPTAFAPTILFLCAQRLLDPQKWWREIPFALALSLLGAGLMINNTFALWQGFFLQPAVFERTPKWGSKDFEGKQVFSSSKYRVRNDALVGIEMLFACFNTYSAIFAWYHNNIGIFFVATLLSVGLAMVSGWTINEMLSNSAKNTNFPKTAL